LRVCVERRTEVLDDGRNDLLERPGILPPQASASGSAPVSENVRQDDEKSIAERVPEVEDTLSSLVRTSVRLYVDFGSKPLECLSQISHLMSKYRELGESRLRSMNQAGLVFESTCKRRNRLS
jgi:hypothetical protein